MSSSPQHINFEDWDAEWSATAMAQTNLGYDDPSGGYAGLQGMATQINNEINPYVFPTQINTEVDQLLLATQFAETNQETPCGVSGNNQPYLVVEGWSANLMPFNGVQQVLNEIHGNEVPTAISSGDYEEHGLPVQTEQPNTLVSSEMSVLPYTPLASSAIDALNTYGLGPQHFNTYYGSAEAQQQLGVGQLSYLDPLQFQPGRAQLTNAFSTSPSSYTEFASSPTSDLGQFYSMPGSSPPDQSDFSNPGSYNPGGYNPGSHNPGGYNPGGYNPGGYNSGGYNTASYGAMANDNSFGNYQGPGQHQVLSTSYGSSDRSTDRLISNRLNAADHAARPPRAIASMPFISNDPQRNGNVTSGGSDPVHQMSQQSIQALQQMVQVKPDFRTKMEILASIGEMKYVMLAGSALSNVPDLVKPAQRINGISIGKSITVEQLAHAKRAEPMAVLFARYGEEILREYPPTEEFLQAIDRRESPGLNTYSIPRRHGVDKEDEVALPYDITTFHPGQYWWNGEPSGAVNLPLAFYRNAPDMPTLHWRKKPPAIVDENGNIVTIAGRALLDFEILPDKIGRNECWWFYELCFRLDPRVEWDDIVIRMIRNDGSRIPSFNLLQMQCSRGRGKWGMKSVVKHRVRRVEDLSTTRGVTPGLVDPDGPDTPTNRMYPTEVVYSGFKCFADLGVAATPAEDLTALEAQENVIETLFLATYPVATVSGSWPSQ